MSTSATPQVSVAECAMAERLKFNSARMIIITICLRNKNHTLLRNNAIRSQAAIVTQARAMRRQVVFRQAQKSKNPSKLGFLA
ncbi:MAG: hypothetical protein IV111_09920 [Pseudomonas sp.]|nr:hypothetical protein [Pseudomonas sp.]